jgi:hypothetical protein
MVSYPRLSVFPLLWTLRSDIPSVPRRYLIFKPVIQLLQITCTTSSITYLDRIGAVLYPVTHSNFFNVNVDQLKHPSLPNCLSFNPSRLVRNLEASSFRLEDHLSCLLVDPYILPGYRIISSSFTVISSRARRMDPRSFCILLDCLSSIYSCKLFGGPALLGYM